VTQHNRLAAAAVTAAVLALAAAAPAAADWLVTRQGGGRVETRGPWQVKGKLVVFTLPDGKLSSLRLSEVDLDASRRATGEAAAAARATPAAPAPAPRPREARVVLTDESFRRAAPPPAAAPDGGAGAAPGQVAPEADAGKITVASWDRIQDPGDRHVVVTGTVRNEAPDDATGVAVTVLLYDDTGKLLVSGEATLSSTILPAGQTGSFRADFPDVFAFAAAKFEARGLHILRKPGEPAQATEGH